MPSEVADESLCRRRHYINKSLANLHLTPPLPFFPSLPQSIQWRQVRPRVHRSAVHVVSLLVKHMPCAQCPNCSNYVPIPSTLLTNTANTSNQVRNRNEGTTKTSFFAPVSSTFMDVTALEILLSLSSHQRDRRTRPRRPRRTGKTGKRDSSPCPCSFSASCKSFSHVSFSSWRSPLSPWSLACDRPASAFGVRFRLWSLGSRPFSWVSASRRRALLRPATFRTQVESNARLVHASSDLATGPARVHLHSDRHRGQLRVVSWLYHDNLWHVKHKH